MANSASGGWVKLHRDLTDKAIWKCSTMEQKVILITLLMMANHEKKQWVWKGKQFTCHAGQFITSIQSIVEMCGNGISQKNVRSALTKFEKLGFLANESSKTGRLITIVNWEKYQGWSTSSGKAKGRQVADRWPTGGRQVATNNNDKNDKNDKEIKEYTPAEPETDHEWTDEEAEAWWNSQEWDD